MSESISQWVSQSVTKRVECSTDRNLPLIFTKLATKVEFREMWKSEIFLSAKPEVELILTIAPMEKYLYVKYLENRWEIRCWTQRRSDRKPPMGFRLAPLPLTFDDLGPSWFKVIKITRQIFRKRWQIRRWAQWKSNRKPPMGYRLAPWPLTLDDLEPT